MKFSFENNKLFYFMSILLISILIGTFSATSYIIPVSLILFVVIIIGYISKKNLELILAVVIFLSFAGGTIPWYLLDIEENRTLIIFGLNLLIFISVIFFNKINLNKYNLTIIFILLILISSFYIATLYSANVSYGQYKIESLFAWAFFPALILVFVWKLPKEKHVLYLLVSVGMLEAFNLLYHFDELMLGRLAYEGQNPIWVARTLGYAALGFLILNIKKKKGYFLFLSVIFLSLMALTGSKGPIISLLLAVLYYIIKTKGIKFIRPILFMSGIVIAFMILIDVENYDITRIFDISGESASFIERFRIYDVGFRAWAESVLFGQGLGGYSAFIGEVGVRTYPHNILIEIISEMGMIGLVIIILLAISTIYSLRVLKNKKIIVEINQTSLYIYPTIFFYVLSNSMFSGDLAQNTSVWVSLTLLIMFSIKLKNQNGNMDT